MKMQWTFLARSTGVLYGFSQYETAQLTSMDLFNNAVDVFLGPRSQAAWNIMLLRVALRSLSHGLERLARCVSLFQSPPPIVHVRRT